MLKRLTIVLEAPEYTALMRAANSDLRNPPDQVRYILRNSLANLGILDLQEPKPDISEEVRVPSLK